MHRPPAPLGMVSHCHNPTFGDFSGLSLSLYGGKADIRGRRAAFGAQIYRSSATDGSPKRFAEAEDKSHLSAKAGRPCLPLTPAQGGYSQIGLILLVKKWMGINLK